MELFLPHFLNGIRRVHCGCTFSDRNKIRSIHISPDNELATCALEQAHNGTMKRHLEDEIEKVFLSRLNNRRRRIERRIWLIYLVVWAAAVMAVFFLLVESDLIVQP